MDAVTPSTLTTSPVAGQGRAGLIANLPLRVKLLLAFLIMTTLATSAVAFFSDSSIRSGMTAAVGEQLNHHTENVAISAGTHVQRQVDLLRAFGFNTVIQQRVQETNTAYNNFTNDIKTTLRKFDEQWAKGDDSDPLVQSKLNNDVSAQIDRYSAVFPNNTLVLVTDRYGAIVAATDRTPRFYLAEEQWWQAAWNDSQGAIVVSQPFLDERTKVLSINIAIPLYGVNSQSVTGVLRTTYRLDDMLDQISEARLGESGRAQLILPDGGYVTADGQLATLPPELLAQITVDAGAEATAASGQKELTIDGVPSFVIHKQVTTTTTSPVVEQLGWSILFHQHRDESLLPVNAAARTAFLISLATLVLAGVLALGVAQLFSQPILRLTQAAQRLAAGDLSHRLALRRGDEIGVLAGSFDAMAQSLEERMVAEQIARTEAERLQQAETESRQRLEQAVGEYLAFTRQVSQGDLTNRITVRYDGSLGELGHGLNAMVANLHSITGQVQEATNAIAAATAQILAATTEQAASSAEQSAAITETATSVEEVKVIAQQTARQATQIAEESQAALQIARDGNQAIESTISGMGQVRQQVRQIAQTMHALTGHSQAIGTIITTVSELADQINHLALNAAIESTRTGKQDQELSNLARLVRELAVRSKSATAEVRGLLVEVQQATRTAVQGTEQGSKGVEEGAGLVNQAGTAIHRLATEVEHGAQANVQMAAASQQQMIGMEQIGLAMISIQQATMQALLGTQQAEQAAQDLHSLAQSLQQAISTYRL